MKKLAIVIFISVVLLLIVVGLAIFLIGFSGSDGPCNSTECVKAASELLSYIDESVDPCDDFYQFSCGKYISNTRLFKERTVDGEMQELINTKIIDMLEAPLEYSDSYPSKVVKSFYHSCMNESLIDLVGTNRMKLLLRQVGGWPLLEDGWSVARFDWRNVTQKLRSLGAHNEVFFIIDQLPNREFPLKATLKVEARRFNLYQNHDKQLEFMTDIAVMLGAKRYSAERDFRDVLKFHNKLVEASNDTYENSTHTIKSLREVYSEHNDFALHLEYYLNTQEINYDVIEVDFRQYQLFKRVFKVIKDTSKKTVANYMLWYVVQKYINLLPEKIRERQKQYLNMMSDFPYPRSEICLEYIAQSASVALLKPYFEEYYSHKVRRDLRDLLNSVKEELRELTNEVFWLDDNSKKIIKDKLTGSEDFVTLDEYFLDKDIDRIFEQVKINTSDPIDSFLKISTATNVYRYELKADRNFDEVYSLKTNKIVLNAHETQGIYFSNDRPEYLNYGALGSSLANHLSILLLEKKKFDYYGNVMQPDATSLEMYTKKLECLKNQYSQFYVPEIEKFLDSTKTVTKDFGYVMSRYVAYKAYENWVENNFEEETLPGLSYTPKQLFWITSAITQCSKQDASAIDYIINNQNVSPSRVRVNGPLRNLDEFSNDFHCATETKMNPRQKCSVL